MIEQPAHDYSTDHPVRAAQPHGCFGCGELNAIGLRLQFYAMPDNAGVWAPFTPTEAFQGYGGIIHGGIVSTMLDEIMAWSLYQRGCWAMTVSMQTRFRRPVEVGVPVRIVGTVVRDRGRLFDVHGEIRREDTDELLAHSDAVFIRVPDARAAEWDAQYGVLGSGGER